MGPGKCGGKRGGEKEEKVKNSARFFLPEIEIKKVRDTGIFLVSYCCQCQESGN